VLHFIQIYHGMLFQDGLTFLEILVSYAKKAANGDGNTA